MKTTVPFRSFTINMSNGERREAEAPSLEALMAAEFGDEATFVKNVATVMWKQKSTLCTYFPETCETHTEIADADVNPYGWRQHHR